MCLNLTVQNYNIFADYANFGVGKMLGFFISHNNLVLARKLLR